MLKNLLHYFVNLRIVTAEQSDLALRQFAVFTSESSLNVDLIHKCSRSGDRLDFYFKKMNVDKYKELAFVCKVIFTLSHGQSSVERGFSVSKTVHADSIVNRSIVSRRIIKEHIIANEWKPHTIDISNRLILDVKASLLKYQADLESVQQQKEAEKVKSQKEILQKEISMVAHCYHVNF